MAPRIQSEGLREFLQQELRENPNATLGSALQHLQDLCERAPGDAVAEQQQWVLELTELRHQYEQHRGLRDFLEL